MRMRLCFAGYFACVRVCGSTCVCSRCSMTPSAGALHLVQAHVSFSLPPRLFANIDHASRAHASKSRRITHLSSRAWWSRPRCSCPDLAGHLTRRAPVLRTPGSDRVCSCHPRLTTPHFYSCGNETIRRKFCKRDLELTSIR